MLDLNKRLKKFSRKERIELEGLVERIVNRNLMGLDCKKLKGLKNFFRVRKGSIRIIFELSSPEVNILNIERRKEDTYKF
ncbi:MAG: hypothetical protein UY71_C0001G0053 [Parcubacteria group bacterium GW2011_GWB1_52_7]|nr:MAG: hypothetical protein UY64_C0014G0026 [Parcubacteria group bacterium GW2011_GWA1_51_12]KKW29243.1 MAG: hypothetical protein UY71_C0001G0053 [Parcubacteria group bacterium GW2011_GWB1_52_7]